MPLRGDGVDRIEIDVTADQVVVRLDGVISQTVDVVERVDVTDSEGSGPFRADRQILVLEPLTLGDTTIDEPVIWPGTFEGSPVVTLKPRHPGERGPDVACRADEPCLLLSSGVNPDGRYADANDPELDENPIDSILVAEQTVTITLDGGEIVSLSADDAMTTTACGLSENRAWRLPPDLVAPIDEPVLIHTVCPTTPGAAIQLVVMDRAAIPALAPLTDRNDGGWCSPGPSCLIFVPE
jgi:hypothetical protein